MAGGYHIEHTALGQENGSSGLLDTKCSDQKHDNYSSDIVQRTPVTAPLIE